MPTVVGRSPAPRAVGAVWRRGSRTRPHFGQRRSSIARPRIAGALEVDDARLPVQLFEDREVVLVDHLLRPLAGEADDDGLEDVGAGERPSSVMSIVVVTSSSAPRWRSRSTSSGVVVFVTIALPRIRSVTAQPKRAGDIEHNRSRLAAEIAVRQAVAKCARLAVAVVLIELRNVVNDSTAASGNIRPRSIGAGKCWHRLTRNVRESH